MLILRPFFSNHTLLDDINAALELDFVLKAQLPKLAVEKSEYDAVLASETESRLDFKVAINASQNQACIYDSLTTVAWQKMPEMTTANTKFNLLSGFDWALVISMIITIFNAFAIAILFLRLKAIFMLLVGVRGGKANFIFSILAITTTKTTDISADMIWKSVKNILSNLVGLEAIMTLVLILLFVGLLIRIFCTKQAISMHQTKIFIYFESATLTVCKHLVDLNYVYNFYKIKVKPAKLSLKQFIIFGYITLRDCVKITNKRTKSLSFHRSLDRLHI